MNARSLTSIEQATNDQSKARIRVWLSLLKTSRQIEGVLRENFRAEYASTLPRFDVMAALDRYPNGLRMSALSDVLRVSNGNVTGIVERLVSERLVARTSVRDDRRASLVRLTAKGRREFARQAQSHESWVNSLLSTINQRDAERMLRDLKSLPTIEQD